MYAFILFLATSTAPTYTVRETVIVSSPKAPASHVVCSTRDLIQGSGTVRTCEVSR